MVDSTQDLFGKTPQELMDAALDSAETFPDDIRTQIEDTYRRLEAERQEWLKGREKKEGQA